MTTGIFKILIAAAVIGLVGCGDNNRKKDAENDQRILDAKLKEMDTLSSSPELAFTADYSKLSTQDLAHHKAKLEQYCSAAKTALAIDGKGRARIILINRITGEKRSGRVVVDDALKYRSSQLDAVNKRMLELGAVDNKGKVIPAMLNSNPPKAPPQQPRTGNPGSGKRPA